MSNFTPSKIAGTKVTFKSGHTVTGSASSSMSSGGPKIAYHSKARVFVLAGVGWESLGSLVAPLNVILRQNHPTSCSVVVYPENFSGDIYSKPLIESSLSMTSAFLMTTSKFGAWRDPSGTTYGLGFSSLSDRDSFASAFTSAVDSLKGADLHRLNEEETLPITTTNLMQDLLLETSRNQASGIKQAVAVDQKKETDLSAEERLFGVIARLKSECEEVKRGSLERRQAEEMMQGELVSKEREVGELRSQVEKERRTRLTAESELRETRAEAGVLRERLRQMEAEVERAEEERAGVDKILDGELSASINSLMKVVAHLKSANNVGGTNK